MKYTHGRRLSKNTVEAVRFVAKVGAMSRETWYELFAQGTSAGDKCNFNI